jgi:hypothetical protein
LHGVYKVRLRLIKTYVSTANGRPLNASLYIAEAPAARLPTEDYIKVQARPDP